LLAKRVASNVKDVIALDRQADLDQFTVAVDRTLTNSFKQFEEELLRGSLTALPFVCFALRKAPVVVGAIDDQNVLLRLLLARLNTIDSLSVLVPKLLRCNEDGSIVSLAPEVLALNPNHVLGMDTFSHLFIWSGDRSGAAQEVRAALVEHLLSTAADRVPAPVLYSFRQVFFLFSFFFFFFFFGVLNRSCCRVIVALDGLLISSFLRTLIRLLKSRRRFRNWQP
jgi:hypothetical protein